MPLHTYICNLCKHCFEMLEGMTAAIPEKKCPSCQSTDVTKQEVNNLNNPGSYTFQGQKLDNVKVKF